MLLLRRLLVCWRPSGVTTSSCFWLGVRLTSWRSKGGKKSWNPWFTPNISSFYYWFQSVSYMNAPWPKWCLLLLHISNPLWLLHPVGSLFSSQNGRCLIFHLTVHGSSRPFHPFCIFCYLSVFLSAMPRHRRRSRRIVWIQRDASQEWDNWQKLWRNFAMAIMRARPVTVHIGC